MDLFITIKEASELVGKVEMTIRRAVKKAPRNMVSTDDKGRLLVDKSYIMSLYNVQSNVTVSETNNDVTIFALTKTIGSLNTRLHEANQIIGSQHKELTETNKMLLEAKNQTIDTTKVDKLEEKLEKQVEVIKELIEAQKPAIDTEKVKGLEETIKELESHRKEQLKTIKRQEDELSLPIEYAPIEKKFPLLEVISIGISVIAVGVFVYFMVNQ